MTELQALAARSIGDLVARSPLNRLREIDGSPIWKAPLVGFADGDDPLFAELKRAVGEDHPTPREALAAHLRGLTGEDAPDPPRVGVVSWALPAAEATRRSNREMTRGPSLRWNHSRFHGEELNDALRRHVEALLRASGHTAVAPVLAEGFRFERTGAGWASNWSERHVAYVAGLGTFGMSRGLITANGIAHRLGSVVTSAGFEPTARDYTHHMEYCLHHQNGGCLACLERCPCGAAAPGAESKDRCHRYLFSELQDWLAQPGYLGEYGGCGLCQTGVPCEAGIPGRARPG